MKRYVQYLVILSFFNISSCATTELESYPVVSGLVEFKDMKLHPLELLSGWRFDVMAKYIYALHRELNVKNEWAHHLYADHLRVWTNFKEEYPAKDTLEHFLKAFNQILDSVKQEGFKISKSIVGVDKRKLLSNGAHRTAACLLYNKQLIARYYSAWNSPCASAEFFRCNNIHTVKGLDEQYLDAMALHYCMLKPNCFMVNLFPVAQGHWQEVTDILRSYGQIIYHKQVQLRPQGAYNFVRLLYENDHWLGNWDNNFAGAPGAAYRRFVDASKPLHVYLFESSDPTKIRECKQKIRDLFNLGTITVHINDTHAQAVDIAKAVFNKNSIHFLNYCKPKKFVKFLAYLEQYRAWLKSSDANEHCFAVDSSAVLAAYGIRECRDLDFLHHGYNQQAHNAPKDVESHNSSLDHYPLGLDDILFDPNYHFYFKDLKFVSLDVIRQMKVMRDEPKDRVDVKMIDELLAQ